MVVLVLAVAASISDTPTLSGLIEPTGEGEVTFTLHKGSDCSQQNQVATLGSNPDAISADGDYTSEGFNTASTGAGAYHWIAHYSGDANNAPVQTGCSDPSEKVMITIPPVAEVKATNVPPPECKLRKARARVFIYIALTRCAW